MKREELITSKAYIVSDIQLKLLNLIENYMEQKGINRNELSMELGVTKGYVSQLLNVSFDHKISKLVDLALSCGKVPLVYFVDKDRLIEDDANDKTYEVFPVIRPIDTTYKESSVKQELKLSNNPPFFIYGRKSTKPFLVHTD
jgi:transcriptional regulator with XRE-family HTH domain